MQNYVKDSLWQYWSQYAKLAKSNFKMNIYTDFFLVKKILITKTEILPKPKDTKREGSPVPLLLSQINRNKSKGRPKMKC